MLKFFWPARVLALTDFRSTWPMATVMVPPVESTAQVEVISSPVISSFSAMADGAAVAASREMIATFNLFNMICTRVGKYEERSVVPDISRNHAISCKR